MVYSETITYTAGGSEASASRSVLKVAKGLIYRVEIEFPPGCAGLCYARILDGLYQIFPASAGKAFHSDDGTIGFDDLYFKSSKPFDLILEGWNEDELYDHTLQYRIAMASSEAFMSRYMPSLSWDKIREALQEAQKIQAADQKAQAAALAAQINAEVSG